MLNKARKLMEQRQVMISEAKEVLAVLGAEIDSVTEITNQIVINKGKVVAVEVENREEIDRLSEENIRLENEICNLQGQIAEYQAKIKELEEQALVSAAAVYNDIFDEELEDELNDIELEVTPVVVSSQAKEETVKETNEVTVPANDNVEVYSSNHGFTHGQVEVEGTKYYFTASNRFDNLVLYGTMDEDIIAKAKYEIIKHYGNSSIFLGYKKQQDEVLYGEDKDNKIVAFCECGVFYGFAGPYYFVWNPTHEVPVGCLINKMYDKKRVLRKMNSSWGKGFVKRGEDIMAVCNELHYIDNSREAYEEQQDKIRRATNEVVVNTNDNVDLTDEDLLDGIDMQ